VYKIHMLTDCEINYVLCSGGHNVGVVNPPLTDANAATFRSTYRSSLRREGDAYLDPDEWLATAKQQNGSWWPAWQAWLASHSGKPIAPQPVGGQGRARQRPIADAPGTYVHAA
jgi:polyhydroxyalkanoate synthase subunit PhaC